MKTVFVCENEPDLTQSVLVCKTKTTGGKSGQVSFRQEDPDQESLPNEYYLFL